MQYSNEANIFIFLNIYHFFQDLFLQFFWDEYTLLLLLVT